MRNATPIAELAVHASVEGIYAASSVERCQGSKAPYWKLTLSDRTGRMPARIWAQGDRLLPEQLSCSCFVEIRGQVTSFREEKQVRIDTVRELPKEEADALDPGDFIVRAFDGEGCLAELLRIAEEEFAYGPWRDLVLGFFRDEANARAFVRASAAKAMHHEGLGGLAAHTLEVARLCRAACDIFPALDRQALLAGAMFHDVGKIREMVVTPCGTEYTNEGTLVGHLVLGVQILGPLCERAGLPEPLRRHLFHLVLSHHGLPEYGTVKEPMTPEALVLHHADMVSAHLNTMQAALKDTVPDSERRMGRTLFFRPAPTPESGGQQEGTPAPERDANDAAQAVAAAATEAEQNQVPAQAVPRDVVPAEETVPGEDGTQGSGDMEDVVPWFDEVPPPDDEFLPPCDLPPADDILPPDACPEPFPHEGDKATARAGAARADDTGGPAEQSPAEARAADGRPAAQEACATPDEGRTAPGDDAPSPREDAAALLDMPMPEADPTDGATPAGHPGDDEAPATPPSGEAAEAPAQAAQADGGHREKTRKKIRQLSLFDI